MPVHDVEKCVIVEVIIHHYLRGPKRQGVERTPQYRAAYRCHSNAVHRQARCTCFTRGRLCRHPASLPQSHTGSGHHCPGSSRPIRATGKPALNTRHASAAWMPAPIANCRASTAHFVIARWSLTLGNFAIANCPSSSRTVRFGRRPPSALTVESRRAWIWWARTC